MCIILNCAIIIFARVIRRYYLVCMRMTLDIAFYKVDTIVRQPIVVYVVCNMLYVVCNMLESI